MPLRPSSAFLRGSERARVDSLNAKVRVTVRGRPSSAVERTVRLMWPKPHEHLTDAGVDVKCTLTDAGDSLDVYHRGGVVEVLTADLSTATPVVPSPNRFSVGTVQPIYHPQGHLGVRRVNVFLLAEDGQGA